MSEFDYFPKRVDDDRLDVVSLLHRGLTGDADRTVLAFEGTPWTAGHLRDAVATCQSWLAGHGVVRGGRVAVMVGNEPGHIALIYALILTGVVWIPVNTKLKSAGLRYLVDHSRPDLFVVGAEFATAFDADFAMPCARVAPPSLAGASGGTLARVDADPFDTLCLIYTSGTTGAPKGVQFTHRMLRIATEAARMVSDAHDGDRLFLWEPLCHIGGAQMLLMPFIVNVELQVVPSFSASRFWSQVTRSRATQLHYLGGIVEILLQQSQDVPPHDLRVAWGAGLSVQTWNAARERFGVEVRECYGMTECSSFATLDTEGRPGTIGKALPWITVDLLDSEGRRVADGEHGEMVLSSRVEGTFLAGYLDNPTATAEAVRDGRLHTGDHAWRDGNGDYHFVGRRTDSMRVRGENVSAWEVERVFAQHPALARTAAIGVTSAVGEQEILIYLQGESLDAAALATWAAERLATFQVPRYYKWIDQFDLTPSERVRKHLLSRDLAGAWDRRERRVVALG